MSYQIGPFKLDSRYILAPMAGITNAPFRRLMREMGSAAVVSELISATGIQYASQKTFELCAYFEEERPFGLQIFGENEVDLANAARFLEEKGADFVDINFGCPVPKVVSKGGGAAMLKDPKRLFEVVSATKKALKNIPLTIKIRTGWDACSINAIETVCAAAEAGAAWVAIHGRTRAQGYEGLADWELIANVKEKSPIPIIGNGDILTAEQAKERLEQSGCDAVMIGRGALRDPFIFQTLARMEGRTIQRESLNYYELIQRHDTLMQQMFKPYFTGIQLRKFMTWFSAGIDGASAFRKKLYEIPVNENTLDEVRALGKEFFDRPQITKSKSYLSEGFLKGGHG